MAKKGLVFISNTSFTTASSVNVDNCFSATYTHYLIKRNLLGSSAGTYVAMRLRVSGSDASGTNYRRQYISPDSTTINANRSTGDTLWFQGAGYVESTTMGFSETWVCNPFEAVCSTAWSDVSLSATSTITAVTNVMAHDLTTSYTGFTLVTGAGTITGSVSVFGLVTA